MELRNKIIVPVLAGAIIFSGYGILKYKKIEDENVRLKNELKKLMSDEQVDYVSEELSDIIIYILENEK